MPGRDRSSRYYSRDMDRGSPSGSFDDIEASWSRKPQQYEARRKKEKARQNSMACYHVVVMVFLFIITGGVAYLVYNGAGTSSLLRGGSGQFGALSADACTEDPCKNGGICIGSSSGYICTCAAGWTGMRCETEMFCANQPCQNGVCIEGTNGFHCFCEEGWDGKQCDSDIDECKADPCGTNGICNNSPGSYNCSCTPGFSGVPCKDVDECESGHDCDGNATCTNSAGSYSCSCNDGFTGDGRTCEDDDECRFDRCPNHHYCLNTPGSFSCGCNEGYTDTGTGCAETTSLSMTSSTSSSTGTTTSKHETTTIPLTNTASDSTRTTTLNHETTTIPQTSTAHTGPTQSTTSTPLSTRTTTANSNPTTAESVTTSPVTTVAPTTPEPTPVASWILGQSVTKYNETQVDGTITTDVDSGWKVGSTMEEEISNAANHTGSQGWYYERGWNSGQPGGETPFSPALSLTVGRSDGSYTGDVDSFYASFWFKMAKDYGDRWGDGTKIMVGAGDPTGTTASNHLEIFFEYKYRAKVSMKTKERDGTDTTIVSTLDPTTWHHVQMTLRTYPRDNAEEWSYLIDNTYSHTGGAFYNTNLYVNRLNFASLISPGDNSKKGIYFDDVTYRAFDSSDPNLIRDSYSTSFEPRES